MFDLLEFLRGQVGDKSLERSPVDLSRQQADSERELLVTNGLGSYMSAGLWGENSRKYHGLFVAALNPPVERTVLLSRFDEVVTTDGGIPIALATNLWRSAVAPEGYKLVRELAIYPCPTWVFELPEGVIVKQVAMVPGKQQVVVGYHWLSESGKEATLSLAVLVNCRSFHGETRGSQQWQFQQKQNGRLVSVKAYDSAPELVLRFNRGDYRQQPDWYWGYYWPRESERGLNDSEDCYRLGFIDATLKPGESLSVVAELGGQPIERVDGSLSTIDRAVQLMWKHELELLASAGNPKDRYQRQCVLAADQFVVHRDSTNGGSFLAGYPWFNDWGRDSMISLSGLTLSTGRFAVARSVLTTFGNYLSEGMLPNCFPDFGEMPAYNTADATFWWAWAVQQYYLASADLEFVAAQLPRLEEVVAWHKRGTRHKLHFDPADGLISGGEPGVQLTWMDAKVGDLVVTPRQGKAVEICALWYNFLRVLAELYRRCADADILADRPTGEGKAKEYEALADTALAGMAKFWNEETGCLCDVINDDGRRDASVRPNQLIALSLPYVAYSRQQGKKILAVVEKELLTPFGLRTLSPHDANYQGRYGCGKARANQYDRDITYHQGTVWPWLFGPWVDARLYVEGESEENVAFILQKLETISAHILGEAGLGSISEIFDGDEPYAARGCYAQAWSVAEVLRVRKRLLELSARRATLTTTARR